MSEDEIFLTHILKCKPVDLLINKPVLTPAQESQFQEYKLRRQKGEPLQYIIGSWDFYGLEFKVNPSVLVPRPETEMLVEHAIKVGKEKEFNDILDLGTGSGNIAVTLAKFLPDAEITSVDVSEQALSLAKENAQHHGVGDQIDFIHEDMAKFLEKIASTASRNDTKLFDLIISNPPYIPSGQIKVLPKDVQQEPALALDGGADGLDFYRSIIKHTPRLLSVGGCLMMEFGDGQGQAIKMLAQPFFAKIEIHQDLTGKDRFIVCN